MCVAPGDSGCSDRGRQGSFAAMSDAELTVEGLPDHGSVIEHPDKSGNLPSSNPVKAALLTLVPSQSKAGLLALFDGRASYPAIRKWREGRRAMPPWAIDLIRAKLAAKAAEITAPGDLIKTGPGQGWNRGAARGAGEWRARR